jgi:hypothetical protein
MQPAVRKFNALCLRSRWQVQTIKDIIVCIYKILVYYFSPFFTSLLFSKIL